MLHQLPGLGYSIMIAQANEGKIVYFRPFAHRNVICLFVQGKCSRWMSWIVRHSPQATQAMGIRSTT